MEKAFFEVVGVDFHQVICIFLELLGLLERGMHYLNGVDQSIYWFKIGNDYSRRVMEKAGSRRSLRCMGFSNHTPPFISLTTCSFEGESD